MKKVMKVKFKNGFSFNGQWYKKDEVKEFDTSVAKALIGRGVATEVVEKKAPAKSK